MNEQRRQAVEAMTELAEAWRNLAREAEHEERPSYLAEVDFETLRADPYVGQAQEKHPWGTLVALWVAVSAEIPLPHHPAGHHICHVVGCGRIKVYRAADSQLVTILGTRSGQEVSCAVGRVTLVVEGGPALILYWLPKA